MNDQWSKNSGLSDLLCEAESCSIIEQDSRCKGEVDVVETAEIPRLVNPLEPAYVLQHEKYEHRIVAFMKAQGLNDKEIAEKTGLHTVTIGYIKKQPWFEKLVLSEIHKKGEEALAVLSAATVESAKALIAIMREAENLETKRKACNDILDRRYGKPNQPMSMSGKSADELSNEELAKIVSGNN